MPTIPAGDLAKLRDKNQISSWYVSFASKPTLWSATINDASIARGEESISFNGGSGAAFAAINAPQEVWVGSAAGEDDYGRLRIRSISSGDGGVTGTVTVARNAIPFVDGLHLTFKHDYPIKPRYPFIDSSGTFYKDGDIAYSGQNESPHPVVIAGGHRAGFLDGGSWVINSLLPNSYAIDPGASISSYSASSYPSTGVSISINSGTGIGTITFTQSGEYWVKYSVTDSNGTTQDSWRFYHVHDRSKSGDFPFYQFEAASISGDWEGGGWSCGIKIHKNVDVDEIPEGALCIIWQEVEWGGTSDVVSAIPDNSKVILVGYTRKETITQDTAKGAHTVDFVVESVESVLRNHYMFSVSLASRPSPGAWYEYPSYLTVGRAVHHLWKWHSTVMETTDVFGLTYNTDGRAYAELQDGTLYTMADDLARQAGNRIHVTCEKDGALRLTPDVQLLPDSERSPLDVVMDITNDDKSGPVTLVHEVDKKTAFVKTSGFHFFATFDDNGCPSPPCCPETPCCPDPPCPVVEPLCASAPGILPDDEGAGVVEFNKQVFRSQTHCNEIAGRLFAQLNNPYPEFRVTLPGNYLGYADPSYAEFWRTSLQTSDTGRDIVWSGKNLILRRVTATYSDGYVSTDLIFEPEADGFDGVAGYCLDDWPQLPGEGEDPPDPPDPPPITGGGGTVAVYTAGSVEYTPKTTNLWFQKTADATEDLLLDPYWKDKATDPTDATQSILIRCGVGSIERSTDGGDTWTDVTPGDPPNDASDSPAPTAATVTYRQGDASLANSGEFIFIVRWQNSSGLWRSWLLFTDDDCSTWSWQSIGTSGSSGYTEYPYQVWEPANGSVNIRSSAFDSSCFIIARDDNTSVASSNLSLFAIVPDISNKTITVNDTLDYGSNKLLRDLAVLSDTKMLLTFRSGPGTANLRLIEYSSCGSLNQVDSVPAPGLSVSDGGYVCRINNTTGLYAYPELATIGGDTPGLRSARVDISGSTMSITSYHRFQTDSSSTITDLKPIGTNGLVMYKHGTTGRPMVQVLDTSPSSGTAIEIDTNTMNITGGDPQLAVLDSSTAIAVWASGGSIKACIVNVSGLTATSTTPITLTSMGSEPAVYKYSSSSAVVVGNSNIATLEVSGSSLTQTDTESYTSTSGNISLIVLDQVPVLMYEEAPVPENRLTFFEFVDAVGGVDGYVYRGLGVSTTKIDGDSAWATYWSDDELLTRKYSLPGLSESDELRLGAATETAVDTLQFIAYPYTSTIDEDTIYIFGRMDDPTNLGSPVHIIKSTDGGSTWSSVVASWGGDFCGAFVMESDGLINAIRCSTYISKFYRGSSFSLLSTINFASHVTPHSFAINPSDGEVYVAAAQSISEQVSLAQPPYTSWSDITYNHPTNGVNSVVIVS